MEDLGDLQFKLVTGDSFALYGKCFILVRTIFYVFLSLTAELTDPLQSSVNIKRLDHVIDCPHRDQPLNH